MMEQKKIKSKCSIDNIADEETFKRKNKSKSKKKNVK